MLNSCKSGLIGVYAVLMTRKRPQSCGLHAATADGLVSYGWRRRENFADTYPVRLLHNLVQDERHPIECMVRQPDGKVVVGQNIFKLHLHSMQLSRIRVCSHMRVVMAVAWLGRSSLCLEITGVMGTLRS